MSGEPAAKILGEPVETVTCECTAVVKVAGLPPLSLVECPKCRRTFPVSVRLGQFLLLKRLGHGAMGEVFEAKDITLGRHVAIKVMGTKVAADEETMRSFLREARHLAALNHRNVVQVHSIGVEKGQPYIVMELVPGGRVDQMIKKGEPGDERRLLEIMIDAARGLEAASHAGLVHGDVKPANILIDKHGQGKIVDFGLARFEESQVGGKIYGTPFYLPPELLKGKTADFRSDMYSLGASFFHALVGRPPFKAKTVKDIVRMRLIEPAPNIRTVVPTMHPKTGATIARLLEKDPAARHESYAELITDLQAAIAEVDAGLVDPALVELHEALSEVDRSASRSGRVQRADYEAAGRSRSHMGGHSGVIEEERPKWPLYAGIGGGVLVLLIIIFVLVGGGGAPPVDDPTKRSFVDDFDAPTLDSAWQFLDGGGALLAGLYQITDKDPGKRPGIKRIIGQGTCTIDFNISRIQWSDADGAVQCEIWDNPSAGLLIHLWKAQGKYYLELKAIGTTQGGRVLGRSDLEVPPTSLRLRAVWFHETQRWRVTYGINGEPASIEAAGSPASDPAIVGNTPDRFLQIRTEQYGSGNPLIMDLKQVSVEFEPLK